jgi:hypothetical protein
VLRSFVVRAFAVRRPFSVRICFAQFVFVKVHTFSEDVERLILSLLGLRSATAHGLAALSFDVRPSVSNVLAQGHNSSVGPAAMESRCHLHSQVPAPDRGAQQCHCLLAWQAPDHLRISRYGRNLARPGASASLVAVWT